MKKSLILFILFMPLLTLRAQYYTVSGGKGTPYMIEDVPNKLQIYVVNGAEDVEIRYTSSSSAHQWYRYKTKFVEREAIPCSQVGETSYVSGVEDGYGYCVYKEGELAKCVWIIDYAKHPFALQSLAVKPGGSPCGGIALAGSPQPDKLYYVTPAGARTEVGREMDLTYVTLEWDEEAAQYNEVEKTETVGMEVFEKGMIEALLPTSFCLTGDQFARHFQMEKTVCTDEYEPSRVELHIDTAVVVTEAENMSSAQSGLSAPATVRFTALANEPVASIFLWKIYKKEEGEENALVHFNDPEVEYTFTEYGDYVAQVEVSNADGSCSQADEIQLSIAESFLDVPNAFSPGTSPGVNDEFRVVYKSLVKFSCWIFNRWGQLLYHWTDPAQGWDGKKGGRYVSPGVYFYVIEAEGSDGIHYKKKGDINVLRPKTIDDQINPDEGGMEPAG